MNMPRGLTFKLLITGFYLSSLALLAQQPGGLKILQTESRFTIDGDLADWAGFAEVPIQFTAEGKTLPPSADLTVTARFSFDSEYFYAALKVLDDRVEFPDMGRREGDGFYLAFVSPEGATANERSLIFGFSRFGNEPIALLDRPGDEAAGPVRDVQLQIKWNEPEQTVYYELAIPWKYVPYFRPFFQQKLGINVTYDDLDEGQKEIVQLVPDPEYSPESAAPKNSLSVEFVLGPARALEFQSSLNANHFYPEDERSLDLVVRSPEPQSGWQARMFLTTPLGNIQSQRPLSFSQGTNRLGFPVELEKTATGIYDLSLGVIDEKGALRYTDDKRFFLLDRKEFDALEARMADIKKGEPYAKDPVFRESLPTLEVRFQWIRDFMEKSPPFADLESIQQWNLDIKDLFKLAEVAKPALFPSGRIARLGYRSEADGALRSYSVLVPDWVDQKTPLPLLVTLAGRAADERRAMFVLTSSYFGPKVRKRAGDFFIVAPEVDDPAGWYSGGSAQRVIETIEHLAKIYSVNTKSIVLDGFFRGGYGALRLALQNPGSFRGVIVRSGTLIPPQHSGAENIMDMLDRAKNLNILFVHGEQDKAAPVDEIRQAVARLQELKANVRLIEVKGTGLENFDKWDDIFSWLRDTLGDSIVEIKPPKKGRDKDQEKKKKSLSTASPALSRPIRSDLVRVRLPEFP
jgi:pimeloyl-ACP methyl ester carboxylesterase